MKNQIEEEAKKPEVKPEDSPVVETTEVPSEDTIPEKDMQAEIDNDLNKKDVEVEFGEMSEEGYKEYFQSKIDTMDLIQQTLQICMILVDYLEVYGF